MTKPGLQHSFIQQTPLSTGRIELQDLVEIHSVISAWRDERCIIVNVGGTWQVLPVRKTLLSMLSPLRPDLGEGRLPTVVQCGEFSLSSSVEEEA